MGGELGGLKKKFLGGVIFPYLLPYENDFGILGSYSPDCLPREVDPGHDLDPLGDRGGAG